MRTTLLILAVLLMPAFAAPLRADDDETPRDRLIKAAGAHRFDQVRELRFTFNVARDGQPGVSRSFIWKPATQELTVKGPGKDGKAIDVTYRRDQLNDQSPPDVVQADKWFINDSFWLIMPLHLSWSSDAKIEDMGLKPLPIGEGQARLIVVTYPASAGGYTPGDAYDLYVDPSSWMITQWIFRRGGAEPQPASATVFEDIHMVGPLRMAFEHHNADKTFRLWFSDVSATLTDGKEATPQPTRKMQKRD